VNKRVLLADDSTTIQRVVELSFAGGDVSVVSVGDGDQAVEAIRRSPPDLVLADIGMPGRSGYEVVEVIPRFLPYTTRSALPQSPWLVRAYLAFRPAWPQARAKMAVYLMSVSPQFQVLK